MARAPSIIPVGIATAARPNIWDWAALPLVFGLIGLAAYGGAQMATPYRLGEALPLSLDPANLPYYLLRTGLRMAAAMMLSLLFTLVYATLAAKSRRMERLLLPILDILQSIPILGFLSITVIGFIALFPGNLFGVECAAIFAIFTSQAWNMTFSLYQSLRTVPADLAEAADLFHLSGWHRFWRLELPYAMPQLVWNMMMSVSGGWFFVVASEAISVAGQDIKLPGVGSYIALAIAARNLAAVGWAVATMLVAILLYDQLLFRPLIAWADKFKFEQQPGEAAPASWLLTLWQRTRLLRRLTAPAAALWEASLRLFRRRPAPSAQHPPPAWTGGGWVDRAWTIILSVAAGAAAVKLAQFVQTEAGWGEVRQVFLYGLATLARVLALMILASLVWVPVGVWIGLRPRLARNVQWIAQFLAAFPANLMFPVAVALIVRHDLNVEIWTSPLMVLGTQWYILFNVVAGAAALPADLRDAAGNLGLAGWVRWRRFILPGIFPSYLTGAITASGGSWNASIVAEMVSWGDRTLTATGLGSYIARNTALGDFPRIALGIAVMCLFVMSLNRFFWRRLYKLAEERLTLG